MRRPLSASLPPVQPRGGTTPVVPRYHRWPGALGAVAGVLCVLLATGEVLGWPMLAEPLQRWLSSALHHRVSFAVDGRTPASVSVRLIGRLRIEAPQVTVAAPAWSASAAMLRARDAVVSLHYVDLWRSWHGEPLHVHMLEAAELDLVLERLADGRASWQASERADRAAEEPVPWPLFDQLKADAGTLALRDDKAALRLTARIVTSDLPSPGIQVEAAGDWAGRPLRLTIRSRPGLPWVNRDPDAEPALAVLEGSMANVPMGVTTSVRDLWSGALLASRLADQRVPHPAPR